MKTKDDSGAAPKIPGTVIDDLKCAVAAVHAKNNGKPIMSADIDRAVRLRRVYECWRIFLFSFGHLWAWLSLSTLAAASVYATSAALSGWTLAAAGIIQTVVIVPLGARLYSWINQQLRRRVNFDLHERYSDDLNRLVSIHAFEPFSSDYVPGTLETVLVERVRNDVRVELGEQRGGAVRTEPSPRHRNISKTLNLIVGLKYMNSWHIPASHPIPKKRLDARVDYLFTKLFRDPDWYFGKPVEIAPGPVGA